MKKLMRFTYILLWSLLSLTACGVGERAPAEDLNKVPYVPTLLSTFHWQLQGDVEGDVDEGKIVDADIYDIDLFDSSATLIDTLHNNGIKVICYFSGGSYESWRKDKASFEEEDLGNSLDGWAGERWLDIRSVNVKNIMKARLDLAKQKDCDGVEPDNMDGYTDSNDTGFDFSSADQLEYNRFIAAQAHERGLSVGLKNDLDQISDLVDDFDFAVNEQCHQYSECDALKPFTDKGKAVFIVEYNSVYNNDNLGGICPASLINKFTTLVLPLELDNSFRRSCL